MFRWGESTVGPIGIDIGAQRINMMQFRRRTGELTLIAAASADIPNAATPDLQARAIAVTSTLRQLMAAGSFKGNHCVSALPSGNVHTKSVRLPQMPESDVAQAVRWEAKDRLGFDLTDGHLAFFRAGEVRRGTEVKDEWLLFAATADLLRSHIQQITAAGLRLRAIDLQPCALLRAVQRVTPAPAGVPTAIVDIGTVGTQLVIAQDDRLAFYKHIDIGVATFDQAVAQKLGVSLPEASQLRSRLLCVTSASDLEQDPAGHLEQAVFDALRPALDDLGRELDMCVRYYVVTFRGTRPDCIALACAQAHCPRVVESLSSSLAVRFEAAQPLRAVAGLTEITRPDRASQWALAAGLALYDQADVTARQPAEVAA